MDAKMFTILGLDLTASNQDIKQAYRRLSLEHHPDRNGNSVESKKRFQTIYDAYMYLTNLTPNTTECTLYTKDSFHPTEDTTSFTDKPLSLTTTLEITLEQAYRGCMVPIMIERTIQERNTSRLETETFYVKVPKGIDHNEILTFANKGNVSSQHYGNLKVVVVIHPHSFFTRKGLDLIYMKRISLREALCGLSCSILHISGYKLKLSNQSGEVITPNFIQTIQGFGLEREDHKGNLIIHFIIDFPTHLTDEVVHTLHTIL